MLVAAGSNLMLKDLQGNTATALARRADDEQLAEYLQSKLEAKEKCNEKESLAMPDHSSSSSPSEDKNDEFRSKADKAELASLAIRTAYQEMSKQFSNYTIDSCSSGESSSTDEKSFVKSTCTCSGSSYRGSGEPNNDPFSPRKLCGQTVSAMVHSESDNSVAPVHASRNFNFIRGSHGSDSTIGNYECLECQGKYSFDQDSDQLYNHAGIFSTLDECEETVFDRDTYERNLSGSIRKPSVDNSEVFEMYSFSRASKNKEPAIAPVHSKPLKSIIKNRSNKKVDSIKVTKTLSTSSRISQSLRSSHSVRSTRSLISSRSIGGSLRTSWGSHQSNSSFRHTPAATPPKAPNTSTSSSPCKNQAIAAAGHASSVVLALAATHASTLALAYNPMKFPLITPAAAAQAQVLTQALADALLEEGRNVSRPLSRSLREERQRGVSKRIKLERLI